MNPLAVLTTLCALLTAAVAVLLVERRQLHRDLAEQREELIEQWVRHRLQMAARESEPFSVN